MRTVPNALRITEGGLQRYCLKGIGIKLLISAIWLFLLAPVLAIERPSVSEVEAFRQDGSFDQRLEFARRIGNYRVRADVAQNALQRLRNFVGNPGGETLTAASVLPAWRGMPPISPICGPVSSSLPSAT